MATVIQGRNPYQGLINLGRGAIQGYDKVSRRKGLLEGLTPEQRAVGQNIPLQQLEALVSNMGQEEFLTPTQIAQRDNKRNIAIMKGLYLSGDLGEDGIARLRNLSIIEPLPTPVKKSHEQIVYDAMTKREQENYRAMKAGTKARAGGLTSMTDKQFMWDKMSRAEQAQHIKEQSSVHATRKPLPPVELTYDKYDVHRLEGGGTAWLSTKATSVVPAEFHAIAQKLANEAGGLTPKQIKRTFFGSIENAQGFDEDTKIDQQEALDVIPNLVTASIIQKENPVKVIQDYFEDWNKIKLRDKGVGLFALAEDVKFTTITPLPSEDVQNKITLELVGKLLDDPDDKRLQDRYRKTHGEKDPAKIRAALEELRDNVSFALEDRDPDLIKLGVDELRVLFGGRKKRSK